MTGQMSEEIQGAALVVPRSIMVSILLNGAMGFAVLLVTLFSLVNVEKVITTPTGYPYMQVFLDSTGSVAGATTMASIVTVMEFSANIGILATASRMCWSFCRDRGLPGWQYLKHVTIHQPILAASQKSHRHDSVEVIRSLTLTWILSTQVDPRTALPIRSILFNVLVSVLISFIVLGSSTAFSTYLRSP